jgi:hypothetical protein
VCAAPAAPPTKLRRAPSGRLCLPTKRAKNVASTFLSSELVLGVKDMDQSESPVGRRRSLPGGCPTGIRFKSVAAASLVATVAAVLGAIWLATVDKTDPAILIVLFAWTWFIGRMVGAVVTDDQNHRDLTRRVGIQAFLVATFLLASRHDLGGIERTCAFVAVGAFLGGVYSHALVDGRFKNECRGRRRRSIRAILTA